MWSDSYGTEKASVTLPESTCDQELNKLETGQVLAETSLCLVRKLLFDVSTGCHVKLKFGSLI
jgi:hypothetical protein